MNLQLQRDYLTVPLDTFRRLLRVRAQLTSRIVKDGAQLDDVALPIVETTEAPLSFATSVGRHRRPLKNGML